MRGSRTIRHRAGLQSLPNISSSIIHALLPLPPTCHRPCLLLKAGHRESPRPRQHRVKIAVKTASRSLSRPRQDRCQDRAKIASRSRQDRVKTASRSRQDRVKIAPTSRQDHVKTTSRSRKDRAKTTSRPRQHRAKTALSAVQASPCRRHCLLGCISVAGSIVSGGQDVYWFVRRRLFIGRECRLFLWSPIFLLSPDVWPRRSCISRSSLVYSCRLHACSSDLLTSSVDQGSPSHRCIFEYWVFNLFWSHSQNFEIEFLLNQSDMTHKTIFQWIVLG